MRLRRAFTFGVIACVGIVLAVFFCSQAAIGAFRSRIIPAEDMSIQPVVIVPGASVLANGQPSDVLEDRLRAAYSLYTTGKVEKILVSGDHGSADYDEVNAMRRYLLAKGALPEDIFLDHAGFDTYDTMYRAHNVFGVTKAIVVSQTFHLPRALYIADQLGIEAYGVSAETQPYKKDAEFAFRERFANVKAYLDVLIMSAPEYGGAKIDSNGDGRVTWGE